MARMAIGAEEKKKLYVLGGLLAAIIVVVVVLYVPKGGSTPTPVSVPEPGRNKGDETNKGKAPGSAPGPNAGTDVAATTPSAGGAADASGVSAASLADVSSVRDDPFMPFAKPLPSPTPPPPPPPVPIDPPEIKLAGPGGGLPPFRPRNIDFGGTPPSEIFNTIAPPHIPQRTRIVPSVPLVSTGVSDIARSKNKRLSGVVIGDSIWAVLEITPPNTNGGAGAGPVRGGAGGQEGTAAPTTISRIVHPGDIFVDPTDKHEIRVLRIERVLDGEKTVTRMFIREAYDVNGTVTSVDSYVDLKEKPAEAAAGGPGGPGR